MPPMEPSRLAFGKGMRGFTKPPVRVRNAEGVEALVFA